MADLNEQQEKILGTIAAKRWSQLDEEWEEVLEDAPLPFSFHQPILDKLARKQDPEHLNKLYQRCLDVLLEKNAGETALEIIEYLLTIEEKHEWIRPRALKALQAVYTETAGSRFHDYLDQAGLTNESVSIRKGIQKFLDLLGATKGQVFMHRTWGLGVVKELDLETGKVLIDFELKKAQTLTLDGVRNFLQRIPKDTIHARMALAPAELRDQVKNEPGEVIRLALKSFGGKIKVADLKKVLTTRFLTENEYKSFWEKSKKAIKLDPWVDQVGAGANSELVLRSQPRTFFDAIFAQLLTAKTVTARRDVLRDVRRHGSDAEMTEQDVEALFQLFCKPLNDGLLKSESERLNHGILFIEYSDLFLSKQNPVDVNPLLLGDNVVDLLGSIEGHDGRRVALELIIELRPEQWGEIFADCFIYMDPRTATWMEKELKNRDKDHYRQIGIESVLAKPDANPDLFVWASRNILEESWDHLGESIRPIMICEELLSLLAELEDKLLSENEAEATLARNATTKIRSLLNESNGRYLKKAVQKSTVEEARKILRTIRLHNCLSHQLKSMLESILINEHQELRKASRMEEEEERKKPAFHYTTRPSLDEKRTMLSRLISQEIPAMAKVIEAARELGDLRENAEYHAAKDRQKLLMQQAAELEDLIARARVVEEREVTPDFSRFGTRVQLRDLTTGAVREMTILGMWEADLSRNVISYLTPFGSQLLNRRVGDMFEVTSQDGIKTGYEMLSIEAAMPSSGGGS